MSIKISRQTPRRRSQRVSRPASFIQSSYGRRLRVDHRLLAAISVGNALGSPTLNADDPAAMAGGGNTPPFDQTGSSLSTSVSTGQSAESSSQQASVVESVPDSSLIAELIDAAIALDSASGVHFEAAAPFVENFVMEEFVVERRAIPQSIRVQPSSLNPSDVSEVAEEGESDGHDRWLSDKLLELVFG